MMRQILNIIDGVRPRSTCRSVAASVLVACILSCIFPLSDQNSRPKRDATTDQPRIISQSGNLVFQTAVNHNITFRSSGGGSIVFDGEDLPKLIQSVKQHEQQIQQLTSSTVSTNLEDRIRRIEEQLRSANLNTLNSRITDLTNRVVTLEGASSGSSSGSGRFGRRIDSLEQQVQRLMVLLTTNECQSSPCRNGGTCVDLYNGYSCQCIGGWTGTNCDVDVNECGILQGTDLGCQNGAACSNTIGSFVCQCTANWHGQRCTEAHDDCNSASNDALCGHGTCQNMPRVQEGQPRFKCHCDSGWETDGVNPACSRDVDECAGPRIPCSTLPLVSCINTPGSFVCGSCPPGFTGNGYVCNDINECLENNGGCSLAPRVTCTNFFGARRCGPCPSGYEGDGVTCRFVGICGENNGGCHPLASCQEAPGIIGRSCTCPTGYSGSGVGASGCQSSGSSGACANNPCIHGTCQPSGISYTCSCTAGWTGVNCNQQLDGCVSNPCRNGGTCVGSQSGGYTCTCTSSYTGQNCQTPQQACGGWLTGESGSFGFPSDSSQTYPHGASCAWVISTTPSKIVLLTFLTFKLEEQPSCEYDFLQIHDGASASAQMIGRYCGTRLHGVTLNSTSNQMYLWFRSDASVSADGFGVTWSSAYPTCGGNIRRQSNGVITSPGYPGVYPNRRDCVWTIVVSPGNVISFAFGHLAIETHANCSFDFLEIRDGLSVAHPLLRQYCSTLDPPPLQTTGPYAYIRFHSDGNGNDRGFQISFSATRSVDCGGAYTADQGVIISPHYPNPYPHDAQCVWTITVPVGEVITFNVTNIDLETHGNCLWDFVEVREGSDETGSFVGRYCGNSTPPVYVTNQNTLWIRFKTDTSNRGSGFRATWLVACGGVYTASTGELRSPYFPNPYPNDRECIYRINQPEGTVITLSFVSIDIEAMRNGSCFYDYLEIRNGETGNGPLIGRVCGSRIPAPIQSSGNSLWLKFKSDGSRQNHGFRATYAVSNRGAGVLPGSVCGGSLTGPTGSFQSPAHPNYYPHGVNCTWFITVTPGFIIRLTFSAFALEFNNICAYDYVEVFDNITMSGSMGRFCGTDRPPVLTSTNNVLTIAFRTDSSVSGEGFSASYESLNSTSACGGEVRSQAGVITSPNYPNNYPHNKQCEWIIVMPPGRQIRLNVTDFEMEPHGTCNFDYLEIRNGGFATSPLIGKYCGTTIPNDIRSHSNRLYIKMVTDPSTSHRGFRFYYDGTITGCGGELTAMTGSFVSPNYPLPYSRNAECFWQIRVSLGSRVHLHFVDFFVEAQPSCPMDYVEIRDAGPLGSPIARLCGNSTPDFIESRSNVMWIKFRTDFHNHGRGFHASYHANCNNRLTALTGAIESPNFPNPYPADRDCTWVIEATLGNTINASFTNFEVQTDVDNVSCNHDYLELRHGQDAQGPLIGRYCGHNILPPPVSTTGQWLYVRFVSDNMVARNGFRLEYSVVGCGGQFSAPSGNITSLNYPNPYPHLRECIWTISVRPGSRIELTINDFEVEEHMSCDYDILEIFGGIDVTAPRLTQLCHTQTSTQVLTSSGSNMVLRFKSDGSNSGRGFWATYNTKPAGCGGNYSTRSGTIMSQYYPQVYPHNTDCIWQINVESGQSVVLTFQDFELESSERCRYDYVAVYTSSDFNSSEVMRHCGSSLPNPSVIRSISSQLFIRLRSDSSVSYRGFKASYVTGCGGVRSAESNGRITSPGWPNNYYTLSNCTWLIQAAHSGDRITLTFTHLETENRYGNCSNDYVRVLQGNDEAAPLIGTYCGTTIPAAITSIGSSLVVQFFSDASVQMRGFQATYTKSTSACGGDFTSENGAFNSPQYPDNYQASMECIWTITASAGNRVMLSFSFFNLESSVDCNNDYVEVRKHSSSGQLVGRYCGNQLPQNLTVGNSLWVKFYSNENLSGQGFMAAYNSMYGGYITGTSGQLASPLYPSNYPHLVDYTWTITVRPESRIMVTFQAIDIESLSLTCTYDYIRISDGGDADARVIGSYCGVIVPDAVISSSNQLRVEFHTDSSGSGRGFLINWQAISGDSNITPSPGSTPTPGCGGNFTAGYTDSQLTSPGFPYGYAPRQECWWTISTSFGSKIAIQFTNMSLESHAGCEFDSIAIYSGQLSGPTERVGKYCGSFVPRGVLSSVSNIVFLRFVSDSSNNGSGFALNYRSVCGGFIQSHEGVIRSPGFPTENYPGNSNCTWTIKVPSGLTVHVNFGAFSVAGQPGACDGDYLEILNGENLDSPSLGKFCGSTLPSVPDSSSSYLTLNFVSNGDATTAPGFNVTFNKVQIACGGDVVLSNDIREWYIMSPNYPLNYPSHVDCIWSITVPSGSRVHLSFVEQFSIEYHTSCNYDYVAVRDGGSENSPLLGKNCGTQLPPSMTSSSHVMHVRFRADESSTFLGFKARITFGVCGGSIRGSNGTLTSPGYPSNYPDDVDCEWMIQAPTGHYLTFTFEQLQLESTSNCSAGDFVEIREYNSTGELKQNVCGTDIPNPVDTSDSFAFVRFHSNALTNATGFKLNFAASLEECGGTLTTPTGIISSPNYPGLYAHSRRCEWRIRVTEGRKVTVTFIDLDVEDVSHAQFCTSDYVEVRNGHLPLSPIIGRYCGRTTMPGPVESSSNSMVIAFVTDGTITGRGFKLSYDSNSPSECGAVINATDVSGVIESPGFSDGMSYNTSEQCIWVVTNPVPVNSSINLQFTTLDLESHGECLYDFVEIREGADENGQLLDRFCRMNQLSTYAISSPSPLLWIRFVSDLFKNGQGFQLTYTFTGCGGILTEPGAITSPNFPTNFPANTDCTWKIAAPEGNRIKVRFIALYNFGSLPNCSDGFVEIFNGGLYSSPSAYKYCRSVPPVFISQSNEVRIRFFVGDTITPNRGFKLYYTFETQGCGGYLHAQEGQISSPNWPNNYNNSIECIWEVNVANGYHINMVFTPPFNVISSPPRCRDDYLEIQELRPNLGPSYLGRFCGNQLPNSISSSSNRLKIKFKSRGSTSGQGFSLNFTAGCGANFTANQGVVMSPGYPGNYQNNLNCVYNIIGDPQKYTMITFDTNHFNIEGLRTTDDFNKNLFAELPTPWPAFGNRRDGLLKLDYDWLQHIYPNTTFPTHAFFRCQYDYVEVSSVNGSTVRPLGRFCGTHPPQPLMAIGSMRIRFVTDESHTDRGWIANFQVTECGGIFREASGSISTPAHPSQYVNNANCTWVIITIPNKIVRLRFESFSLEAHLQCRFDYVAIYNGNQTDASRLIGRYCGSVLPSTISSSGNMMLINFVSDESDTRDGFRAVYTTTYGCGGLLNATTGTIQSLDANGDNVYENDLECVWQIIVPQENVIALQFQYIDLFGSNATQSCDDFIELRDGILPTEPLVGKYCGTQSAFNYTSTTNMLYIKFVSDGESGARGFQATYSILPRLCGGTLLGDYAEKSLTSPNYPDGYSTGLACRWMLDAPLGEHVEIDVTALDLDNHTNCDNDYLEFVDVPQTSSVHPVVACGSVVPATFISSGRTVMINFMSSQVSSGTHRGFSLNYKIASCNRTYTADVGHITSPRWPNNYPQNAFCQTDIITAPGNKLSLYFGTFEMEHHDFCRYDYLQVLNGIESNASTVARLCGGMIPNPIFLNGNTARLILVTDASTSRKGYDITYTSSPSGCGGQLNSLEGTLASPEYPSNLASEVVCRWSIQVPARRHLIVHLTVEPSRRNPADDCTNSRVTIHDGPSESSPSTSYCSSDRIAPWRSSTNRIQVIFASSNSTLSTNIAFRLRYSSSSQTTYSYPVTSSPAETQSQANEDYNYNEDEY